MPGVKLTPIQPKRNPFGSPSQIQKLVDGVLDDQADDAKKLVESIVGNWSAKSKPKIRVTKSRSERVTHIEGEIYGFVDLGTRPHIIKVRRARFLKFQSGFTPKTLPGKMSSGKGGRSGGFVFRRQVHHPGSKARGFTKAIGKQQQKEFPKRFRSALKSYFKR